MRVVCIGAGFSGILAAIRVPEWLRNVEFQVYEKNEGVGGTWWENRYPGCACDIPGKFSRTETSCIQVLHD
jgi:cation diffusion facilitator CzcD-associated flavoprotein CzcO